VNELGDEQNFPHKFCVSVGCKKFGVKRRKLQPVRRQVPRLGKKQLVRIKNRPDNGTDRKFEISAAFHTDENNSAPDQISALENEKTPKQSQKCNHDKKLRTFLQ
jgi:hypothetical protein